MHISVESRPSEAMYNYNSIRLNVLSGRVAEADMGNKKADITKAIADAAKDFTLQQYQYFVRTGAGQSDRAFLTGKKFAL